MRKGWGPRSFCVSDEHYVPTLLAALGLDAETDCTVGLGCLAKLLSCMWPRLRRISQYHGHVPEQLLGSQGIAGMVPLLGSALPWLLDPCWSHLPPPNMLFVACHLVSSCSWRPWRPAGAVHVGQVAAWQGSEQERCLQGGLTSTTWDGNTAHPRTHSKDDVTPELLAWLRKELPEGEHMTMRAPCTWPTAQGCLQSGPACPCSTGWPRWHSHCHLQPIAGSTQATRAPDQPSHGCTGLVAAPSCVTLQQRKKNKKALHVEPFLTPDNSLPPSSTAAESSMAAAGDQLVPVCDTGPMLHSVATLFPWRALEAGLHAQAGTLGLGAAGQAGTGSGAGEMPVFTGPDDDRGAGITQQVRGRPVRVAGVSGHRAGGLWFRTACG